MSVRSLMGMLLTFMTLVSSRCVFSQNTNNGSDQQQQLIQIEQKWLDAETENDPDTLQTILADDFIHVLPDGFITKKEHIDFRRRHSASRHHDQKLENLKVRIFGNTAVVTGIVAASPGDGSIHETAFTDVFVYRDGRWQAVNAQETPMTETSNPIGNSVISLGTGMAHTTTSGSVKVSRSSTISYPQAHGSDIDSVDSVSPGGRGICRRARRQTPARGCARIGG